MAPVSTEPCKVVSFLWLLQYHCLLPLQWSCVKSVFSLVAEQLGLLCSSCRRNTSPLQSQHVHCKHCSYKLRQHEAESEGASDPYIWSTEFTGSAVLPLCEISCTSQQMSAMQTWMFLPPRLPWQTTDKNRHLSMAHLTYIRYLVEDERNGGLESIEWINYTSWRRPRGLAQAEMATFQVLMNSEVNPSLCIVIDLVSLFLSHRCWESAF